MSLKSFHIFFIGVSVLLALGMALLSFRAFLAEPGLLHFCCTVTAALAGVSLTLYARYFLKKLRHVRII